MQLRHCGNLLSLQRRPPVALMAATVSLDSGGNDRCGTSSQTPKDFYTKIKQ